jgi:ribonuclease III family protein
VRFEDMDSGETVIRQEVGLGLSTEFLSFSASSRAATLVQQSSPAALAYLGDAVYELYVRAWYLVPAKRLQAYHAQVVSNVRAETQALHLHLLMPHLTEEECEVIRRGRNAAVNRPKRVDPKTYQEATSLEALIGYLYITNPQRLSQLLAKLEPCLRQPDCLEQSTSEDAAEDAVEDS